MKSTHHRQAVFSLLLAALLLCGGCGPGTAETTATPSPSQTQPAAPPTPEAPPVPTPEATPTPEVTPTPTAEATPTQEVTPSPTPEATPSAEVTTTPTAKPSPEVTAAPSAKPTATAKPEPTPTPTPEPDPISFEVPDATALDAAELAAGTVMFSNGVKAEQFLKEVNAAIARWEEEFAATYGTDGPSDKFNWHTPLTGSLKGKTVLQQVKAEVLEALGTNQDAGTDAYKNFDIQVYYSRLIDLLGDPLPWGALGASV